MKHEHIDYKTCARAGCVKREKQKPSDHPKNVAKRERQAATKAWHEVHGVEHARSGCRQ